MPYTIPYDSDFDGAQFLELFENGESSSEGDQEYAAPVFHHPGTDDNDEQDLGKLHETFEVKAGVNGETDKNTLRDKLGTKATLTRNGRARSSCRLVRVTGVRKHRKLDIWTLQLSFQRVT